MKNLDTMLLHNLLHANEGTNKLMLQNTQLELRISIYAGVTQRLECLPSKQGVEGSNPFSRSILFVNKKDDSK